MTRNTIHPVQVILRRRFRAVISAVMCIALLLCIVPMLQVDAHAASTVRTAGTLEELQNALAIAEGGDIIQLTAMIYIDSSAEIKAPKASIDNPVIIYSKPDANMRHFETSPMTSNLTIEFGNVVLDGGGVSGGINVTIAKTTIINAVIHNCKATNNFGGGINADYNDLTVVNSKIVGNTADFGGGGIYGGGVINVIGSEIIGNEAMMSDGGGICAVGSESKLVIKKSIVKGNTAPEYCEDEVFAQGGLTALPPDALFVM